MPGQGGWLTFGGTSLSAPIIAGVFALSGQTAFLAAPSIPYAQKNYSTNLHDILSGSNGSCSGSYLCTATANYDGPTGLGSPNGAGAF